MLTAIVVGLVEPIVSIEYVNGMYHFRLLNLKKNQVIRLVNTK